MLGNRPDTTVREQPYRQTPAVFRGLGGDFPKADNKESLRHDPGFRFSEGTLELPRFRGQLSAEVDFPRSRFAGFLPERAQVGLPSRLSQALNTERPTPQKHSEIVSIPSSQRSALRGHNRSQLEHGCPSEQVPVCHARRFLVVFDDIVV